MCVFRNTALFTEVSQEIHLFRAITLYQGKEKIFTTFLCLLDDSERYYFVFDIRLDVKVHAKRVLSRYEELSDVEKCFTGQTTFIDNLKDLS